MNIENIYGREARFFYIIGYLDARGLNNDDIHGLERLYDLMASFGRIYADKCQDILENDELDEEEVIIALMSLFNTIRHEKTNKILKTLNKYEVI